MSRMSGIPTGSALALCCALASCADLTPLSRGVIEGRVVLGVEPIAGATVAAYRLDAAGKRYTDPIAVDITDDTGAYRLDMGAAHGTILLETTGGSAREHWAPELLVFDDSEAREQLRAVIPLYRPAVPRKAAITPFTTMAVALAEGRLTARKAASYRDAAEQANMFMSAHLGVDILATVPADIRVFVDGVSAPVAYSLILAGLSTLAGRIEAETPDSVFVVNTMSLTAALADDARVASPGDEPIFDGMGPDGAIDMGVCIPPPECMDPADCPLCLLASRTLRRDLAESLLFWFVPSDANKSGRGFMDVAEIATRIAESTAPELFGMVTAEPLDAEPPRIAILPSEIRDERGDDITFDAFAAPIHDPIGPAIDLSDGSQCPTVYKHVNRLDDASQNPLRWRFTAIDDGAGVQLVEYRVRNLSSGQWLTDWTPVQPTTPGDIEYAIVLVRGDVPALATSEAVMEIQIRARDWFANLAGPVSRCWQHVPLAAPLRVGPAIEATGPGSLQAVDIDPDTYDLAMLINATTDREIMWFEVANGTDDPVYVTFDYAQPGAEYDLTWQRSNLELSQETPPPDCTTDVDGSCPLDWPEAYQTDGATLINQPIPANTWNLRVWDITGVPYTIDPCNGCDANEYLMAPRLDATRPRRYRIALVTGDLSILAPRHPTEPIEQYDDIEIDPLFPGIIITGKRYGTIFKCIIGFPICMLAGTYRHYRAIRTAAIRMAPVAILGRVAPSEQLPPRQPAARPGTFGIPPTLPSFRWTIDELALPNVDP
jgi:hypothetical protein